MTGRWPFVMLVTVLVSGTVALVALGYEEVTPLLVILAALLKPPFQSSKNSFAASMEEP